MHIRSTKNRVKKVNKTFLFLSRPNKKTSAKCNQRGVTLIELIVFIAVSSIVILALSVVFRQAMVSLQQPSINSQILDMAQYQLNTILSHRYDEASSEDGIPCDIQIACMGIGIESGENQNNIRSLDDVDDFNGLIDIPRSGFSRSVIVTYAGNQLGIANQYAKRIDVTVSSSSVNNASLTLSAYKINQ